jgi:hypothetical protein
MVDPHCGNGRTSRSGRENEGEAMQVHLTRDEIEVAVGNYLRLMFNKAVTVSEISVGGSGQRITAEIDVPGLPIPPAPEVTD